MSNPSRRVDALVTCCYADDPALRPHCEHRAVVAYGPMALCRSCDAGLCLEHLRETAEKFAADAHLASGSMSDTCNHDTWATTITALTGAGEG